MKGERQQRDRNSHPEQDICIHIFTVSSAMVGVCLTVIGLVRVVITLGTADTLADDFLAADALFVTGLLFAFLLGVTLAGPAQNASPRKDRGRNIYRCHNWDGDSLCVDHL
jgi:hypothetical protein